MCKMATDEKTKEMIKFQWKKTLFLYVFFLHKLAEKLVIKKHKNRRNGGKRLDITSDETLTTTLYLLLEKKEHQHAA